MSDTKASRSSESDEEINDEFDPFTASGNNKEIISRIYKTHDDDADEPLEYFSAYLASRHVIQRCHEYFNFLATGSSMPTDNSRFATGFVLPMQLLKEIGAQISSSSFKNEDEVGTSADKATMEILKKVKDYGWEAKVVLALSAWALEFGHSAQSATIPVIQSSPTQFDASLANIQKSPLFMKVKPSLTTKMLPSLLESLESVRTSGLQVIRVMDCIMKLLKLAPAFEAAELKDTEMAGYFYWIIISLVVSAAKLNCLLYNKQDLLCDYMEPYNAKLSSIAAALDKRLNKLYEKHEDAKSYWALLENLNFFFDFQEIFERNIICHWYSGSRVVQEDFNSVLKKDLPVFLVVSSGLDVEVDDLRLMELCLLNIGTFIWAPIFDESWNTDTRDKTECIIKKIDRGHNFYTLEAKPTHLAFRFLKEEWKYSKGKKPITVVVLNKDHAVENICGMNLVSRYAPVSYPFDKVSEMMALETINWPKIVAAKIPEILSLMKHRKRYIFLYGGKDSTFARKFKEPLEIAVESLESTDTDTKVSSFCVGKSTSEIGTEFWKVVKHLHAESYNDVPAIKEELNSMTSLIYKSSWVLMCQGPRLVISGEGDAFVKALKEFNTRWEEGEVTIEDKDSFEAVFKDCYARFIHKA